MIIALDYKETHYCKELLEQIFLPFLIIAVPQIVTSSSGTCPNGFVQCVDGTCEPFEALCGDQGIIESFPYVLYM
jgi:hypothetical protein